MYTPMPVSYWYRQRLGMWLNFFRCSESYRNYFFEEESRIHGQLTAQFIAFYRSIQRIIANSFTCLLAATCTHSLLYKQIPAAFIRVVGSEFVQKYLGEGPRMVRDVFRLAKENSPAIIFIDEIDAIATKR